MDDRYISPAGEGGRRGYRQEKGTARRFLWRVEAGAGRNYAELGRRLARAGDLYRNGTAGVGLTLILPSGETRSITKGSDLAPLIVDRVKMAVTKGGKVTAELPTTTHLNNMLKAEAFLREFRPLVTVARHPFYRADYTLARLGYDEREHALYVGPEPEIADGLETVNRFLDAMDFETHADRTNTVAAALTVRLRHLWPGGLLLALVTATKSHAGKGRSRSSSGGQCPRPTCSKTARTGRCGTSCISC